MARRKGVWMHRIVWIRSDRAVRMTLKWPSNFASMLQNAGRIVSTFVFLKSSNGTLMAHQFDSSPSIHILNPTKLCNQGITIAED